ncbi:hypothetical protein AMS68_007328 [Peltaster fructicola]|uniref:Uncharacterized protein n=1 Tax=Peltaster fructicola TaxID=286661 RepID=A0A6H0Y4G6_9PEZI|nr:hypothetical protein AMS68_007328 [Peltaster fructicola]
MSTMFSNTFIKRDDSIPVSRTTIGLVVALIVLVVIASAAIGTLITLRRRRNRQHQSALPMYNEKRLSAPSSASSSPRRGNKASTESIIVYQEKRNLLENSDSPPSSPLPEIRITFPEEFDEAGKRTSGRVVVVRVGETSVGLEPLSDTPPLYEQTNSGRFQSIDLERVGGLVEKEHDKMWR